MRKSLGSKRQEIGEDDVKLITRTFGDFAAIESYRLDKEPDEKSNRGRQSSSKKKAAKKTFGSKIFESHEFGYRRITIERPLRLSVQFTNERIETLRFATGKLNAAMQKVYELHGDQLFSRLGDSPGSEPSSNATTGAIAQRLRELEPDIRALVKADFADLKEKQIKDLLDPKTWNAQKELLDKATQLQAAIGTDQYDDFNEFEATLKQAIKDTGIELDAKQKKQIIAAVSWTNPNAQPVIKKIISRLGDSPGSNKSERSNKSSATKTGAIARRLTADPTYGTFEYRDQIVEFKPDSDLRDNEDVPLTRETALGSGVDAVNEAYFHKEVAPHVPDAWIDKDKTDDKDEQVGIVGYEIPFSRHFYEYEPPRPLRDIDEELDQLSGEIIGLLQEVHS